MARGPQVKIPRRAGGEKTPEVRWGNRPTYPTVRVSFSLRVPLRNLFHFSKGSHSFFTMADPQRKTSIGPLGEIPHQPHSKNRQRSLGGPRWSQVGLPPGVPPRNLFHFREGAPCVCPRRATRGDTEGPLGARRWPVYWGS